MVGDLAAGNSLHRGDARRAMVQQRRESGPVVRPQRTPWPGPDDAVRFRARLHPTACRGLAGTIPGNPGVGICSSSQRRSRCSPTCSSKLKLVVQLLLDARLEDLENALAGICWPRNCLSEGDDDGHARLGDRRRHQRDATAVERPEFLRSRSLGSSPAAPKEAAIPVRAGTVAAPATDVDREPGSGPASAARASFGRAAQAAARKAAVGGKLGLRRAESTPAATPAGHRETDAQPVANGAGEMRVLGGQDRRERSFVEQEIPVRRHVLVNPIEPPATTRCAATCSSRHRGPP